MELEQFATEIQRSLQELREDVSGFRAMQRDFAVLNERVGNFMARHDKEEESVAKAMEKIGGRVSSLETWRTWLTGAFAVVTVVAVFLKDIIRDGVLFLVGNR